MCFHIIAFYIRAEDEAQTRDPQLGRLMLYQLSYFRIFLWAKMDSNHRRRTSADLQSAPFGHSGIRPNKYLFPFLEPMEGFEPTTPRLQITCSGQLSYIGRKHTPAPTEQYYPVGNGCKFRQ